MQLPKINSPALSNYNSPPESPISSNNIIYNFSTQPQQSNGATNQMLMSQTLESLFSNNKSVYGQSSPFASPEECNSSPTSNSVASSPLVYSIPQHCIPNYGVVLTTANKNNLPPQAWSTPSSNSSSSSNSPNLQFNIGKMPSSKSSHMNNNHNSSSNNNFKSNMFNTNNIVVKDPPSHSDDSSPESYRSPPASPSYDAHWETGLEPLSLQHQFEINPPVPVRSNTVFFEPFAPAEAGRHKACWNLIEPMHRNYYQPIQFKLPIESNPLLSGNVELEPNPAEMALYTRYEGYRIYIHHSLGYSGNAKRFKQYPDVNEKALVLDGNVYDGHLNPIRGCKICTEYYQTKSYFSANPHAKGKVLLIKNNILTRVKDGSFVLSLKPMCCSGHNSHIPLYFHFTLTDPYSNEVEEIRSQQDKEAKSRVIKNTDKPLFPTINNRLGQSVTDGSIVFLAVSLMGDHSLSPLSLEQYARATPGGLLVAKLNVETNPDLAKSLQVRNVPHVYSLFAGQVLEQFQGLPTKEALDKFINDLLAKDESNEGRRLVGRADELLKNGETRAAFELYSQLFRTSGCELNGLRGLFNCAIKDKNMEVLGQLIDVAKEFYPAELTTPLITQAQKMVDLSKELKGSVSEMDQDIDSLIQLVKDSPKDLDAKYKLALKYFENGEVEPSLQQLIDSIKVDRHYQDDSAKQMLFKIFDSIGASDPLVIKYRQRFSNIWFL
eukprot:gene1171-1344_t